MENKIVAVDDEPMMVKNLKRLLMEEPFVFFGFDSTLRTLERMDRISLEVVLSDQHMSEMKGVRFLERIWCCVHIRT